MQLVFFFFLLVKFYGFWLRVILGSSFELKELKGSLEQNWNKVPRRRTTTNGRTWDRGGGVWGGGDFGRKTI